MKASWIQGSFKINIPQACIVYVRHLEKLNDNKLLMKRLLDMDSTNKTVRCVRNLNF